MAQLTEEELKAKKRAQQDKLNEYRRNKRLTDKTYGQLKNPEYFKTYYQSNVKDKKHFCVCCDVEIGHDHRIKHNRTKKHLRNVVVAEKKHNEETYSEFD